MRKIEPIAYVQDSFLQWKPRQSEKVDKVVRTKQEMYGFCTPLYTREALEAVVEGTIWVMVQRAVAQGKDAGFTCGISLDDVLTQILTMQGE